MIHFNPSEFFTASLISRFRSFFSFIDSNPFKFSLYTPIASQVSPLRDRKIEVFHDPVEGLKASIRFLDEGEHTCQTSQLLPVINLPKEVRFLNIPQLRVLFTHAHLLPEKGVEGEYSRVSFHISGKGGMKTSIPFQPGLALGSIIRGNTLEKMEEYATKMAAREAREQQINAAVERIEELRIKIKEKSRIQNKTPAVLIELWKKEIGEIEEFLKKLTEGMSQGPALLEVPLFENFYQALETPIDMAHSTFVIQPRGFDSLQYGSEYIRMEEDLSELHDRITQASSASQVAASGGGWLFKAQASYAWADGIANRIVEIQKSGKARGVLVINAFATTRHVRCFTSIHFDKQKLANIVRAMQSEDEKELNRHGITKNGQEKAIYLLTEAVLGGSFTALVTFLNESEMERRLDKHQEEQGKGYSANMGADMGYANGSFGYARASQNGRQTEDDLLRGITTTQINIQIMSQGVMPTFTKGIIAHEVFKHLDLNPSKFELSKKDEDDAKEMAVSKGPIKAEIVARRQMKMENAQVATLNTIRGLTSATKEQQIHTPQSVMEAYDDFAARITTDEGCGVPIGFNYQKFTQENLIEILASMNRSTSQTGVAASYKEDKDDHKD